MLAGNTFPHTNPKEPFPHWVRRKEGEILLIESDWVEEFGRKYGVLLQGTGSFVTRNTEHAYGGSGSCALITGNLTNDLAEVKTHIEYQERSKLAFEMKVLPAIGFTGNNLDFGIEPREDASNGFWQGRVKYDVLNDRWRIETATDVYSNFTPDIIIDRPFISAINGAGDVWAWARLVIDSIKKEYVSFECAGQGKVEFRDLTGTPLVNRGVATLATNLFFVLGITGANSNEKSYTTDWCITKL